ncbi:hypothetical protein QYE76_062334 [Lolium multiflorum]|uniref:Reverse transcriptase Ty1/copia-type domain-containing protein n=1 Tax=Lolium multiflorum TaxID=4521 RepID=A0AAD8S3E3_LOLMU|nr:hypothetical protein QYE76_062334 [Lolium multiflorum]
MAEEIAALERTGTWDVVTPPSSVRPITCKWVYKIKTRSDGSLERYKARLVARGFQQEHGRDYDETFAPVAHMTTVRTLLAVASVRHWSVSQLDVQNAFLNGELREEVYMQPPDGMVCRLRRSLYGLKQAPRAWFQRFASVVTSAGFVPSAHDPALFVHTSSRGRTLLLLYVDDMIITGDDPEYIAFVKARLRDQFLMTDLGPLRYFLGLELNVRLRATDGDPLPDPTRYRHLVGSLVYLAVTRPDISYPVHILSQFMSAPTSVHYSHLLRVLRYLRGTISRRLFFPRSSSLQLQTYSDATWASDPSDRKSLSAYCVFLGGSLIAWKTKKQVAVSRSSVEAELRAMALLTAEVTWLRWLLADFGVSADAPTPLLSDSTGAISIARDPVKHELTKHIGVDAFYVRHAVQHQVMALHYVPSELQLADFFTNAQTRAHHVFFLSNSVLLIHHEFEGVIEFFFANLLDSAAGGTFMSITLGAATKLLDDMMINYSEWHTERTPQGKKVNSVEETSSLSDKIDVIMSMLVNGRTHVDPNNVPLASLVAQEEHVDVNFIKNNNFNNNAYRNNYGNNNYRPYPSNNGSGYGNSYGNSYNNNKSAPSGLEVMLKEFISTQTAFNKTVEEKLGKIDVLASKVDSLALDVDLLKLKVMPDEVKDAKFAKTNAIQVRINDNIRLMAELHARWDREEKEKLAKENNVAKVWTITTTSNVDSSHVAKPPTINSKIIGVGNVSTPSTKRAKLPETENCL